MSEASKPAGEMNDRLHEVIAVLGSLIGCYPAESLVGRELEQIRKNVMALVIGDITGTLGQESREDARVLQEYQHNKSELRIVRAMTRINQDDALAELVRNSQVLQELVASRR